MQKIKSAVAAAALSLLGLSVHAAAVVDDSELSSVTGQDGVTIGGDLNINIGAFTWTPPAPSNDGAAMPPVAPSQPSPNANAVVPPTNQHQPAVAALLRLFKHQHQRIPGTLVSTPVANTDQTATGASRGWRPALFRTVNALRNGG